jgi:hypothetical protein
MTAQMTFLDAVAAGLELTPAERAGLSEAEILEAEASLDRAEEHRPRNAAQEDWIAFLHQVLAGDVASCLLWQKCLLDAAEAEGSCLAEEWEEEDEGGWVGGWQEDAYRGD